MNSPLEFPAAPVQERLWHARTQPLAPATLTASLSGQLRPAVLIEAFDLLVCRHEILRTTLAVRDGRVVQCVDPGAGAMLVVNDDPGLGGLDTGPLVVAEVTGGGAEHTLTLQAHPAIADQASLGLLLGELLEQYAALLGVGGTPAPPRIQFGDVAVWLQTEFTGLLAPGVHPVRGAATVALPPAALADAGRLARSAGASPQDVLLAAQLAGLARDGRDRVAVEIPVSGRRPETASTLGPFADLARVSVALAPTATHLDLIGVAYAARARAEASAPGCGAVLRAATEPAAGVTGPGAGPAELPPLALTPTPVRRRQAGITMLTRPQSDATAPIVSHAVATVMAFLRGAERPPAGMLPARGAGPGLPASTRHDLPAADVSAPAVHSSPAFHDARSATRGVAPAVANEALAVGGDAPGVADEASAATTGEPRTDAIPGQGPPLPEGPDDVLALLLARAAGGRHAELLADAAVVGAALAALDTRPEDPVAICLPRSADLVRAVLGIWWAGSQYVPLDPSYPHDRLAAMLQDSGAAVIIVDVSTKDLAGRLQPGPDGPRLVTLAELSVLGAEAALGGPDGNNPVAVPASAAAYTIFTSGSTGRPKGVTIPRSAVSALLRAFAQVLPLAPDDRLVAVTTLSFDISVLELLLPLFVGCELIVADEDSAADALALREVLEAAGASAMQATPATWRALAGTGGIPERLRLRLCGGEAVPRDLATVLATGGEAWNVYGPTETTVWSGAGRIELGEDGQALPIVVGPPIPGTRWYVLDDDLRPCPAGAAGDVWIAGSGVARGYLARPGQTADVFRPDLCIAGERMYRTGDVGALQSDGRIVLHGRADHQVKIRGFRIELEEIEVALRAAPGIEDAVVIAVAGPSGQDADRHLAAFVAPGLPAEGEAGVRRHLSAALPAYMVPTLITPLPDLPRTPNGKIDRGGLPTVNWGASRPAAASPPSTPQAPLGPVSRTPQEAAGSPPNTPPNAPSPIPSASGSPAPASEAPPAPARPRGAPGPGPANSGAATDPPRAAAPVPGAGAPAPAPAPASPALPASAAPRPAAPRGGVAERLAGLWTELLGVSDPHPEDNFFALGGHSLTATFLVARIQKEFGVQVRLRELLRRPTIASQVELVESAPQREGGAEAAERHDDVLAKLMGSSA